MSNLARDWVLIDKAATYVSVKAPVSPATKPVQVGDDRALNTEHTPDDDSHAPTDFAYLTVDGSNDAPYIPASGSGGPALPDFLVTYGGNPLTYGGNYLIYGPLTYGGERVTYGGELVTYGV